MENTNSPDSIPSEVWTRTVDRVLQPTDKITSEADFKELLNVRLEEKLDEADALKSDLEERLENERRVDEERAAVHAKDERKNRTIAAKDRVIAEQQTRIAELESAAGELTPWSTPRDILRTFVSGRLLAGVAAVMCVLLFAGPVVDSLKTVASEPPALVPDDFDAERLEDARSTSDQSLGRVRAIGYTYDPSRRQALVAISVTPSAEAKVDFYAISGAYSSLAVGHAVLKAQTAGFAEGAYDADHVVDVWRRASFSVVDARRAIERDPEVQVAPGKTYTVLLPFQVADLETFEQGRWATLSLVALSSASLDALEPDLRFGKDLEDAAYGVDRDGRFAHLGAIRLQVAVPYIQFNESREKTFRLRRPSSVTAGA